MCMVTLLIYNVLKRSIKYDLYHYSSVRTHLLGLRMAKMDTLFAASCVNSPPAYGDVRTFLCVLSYIRGIV